jgi:hypothetical protein
MKVERRGDVLWVCRSVVCCILVDKGREGPRAAAVSHMRWGSDRCPRVPLRATLP